MNEKVKNSTIILSVSSFASAGSIIGAWLFVENYFVNSAEAGEAHQQMMISTQRQIIDLRLQVLRSELNMIQRRVQSGESTQWDSEYLRMLSDQWKMLQQEKNKLDQTSQ